MFGKKCSLCGGKLNSENVCTECGLDNTKTDRNYKINQSSCDNQPLTHVHPHPEETDRRKVQADRASGQKRQEPKQKRQELEQKRWVQQQPSQKKNSKKRVVLIPVIFIILGIAASVISAVGDMAQEWGGSGLEEITGLFDDYDYNYEYDYNPYEYVQRELSEDGESFRVDLSQGEYVGGVHLPEGAYTVSIKEGYASVNVTDDANGIYLYESLNMQENAQCEDVRIYTGARVEVSGEASVEFATENGQMDESAAMEQNPLTETVTLRGGEMQAGVDFEPGVYDLYMENGYVSLQVMVYDGPDLIQESYLWLDADSSGTNGYKNLVLPQGAVISWEEEEQEMVLKPSEGIISQDYLSYYVQEGEDYGE